MMRLQLGVSSETIFAVHEKATIAARADSGRVDQGAGDLGSQCHCRRRGNLPTDQPRDHSSHRRLSRHGLLAAGQNFEQTAADLQAAVSEHNSRETPLFAASIGHKALAGAVDKQSVEGGS
jgi:hypothetical protein